MVTSKRSRSPALSKVDARVLLIEEPTQGIDVHAKAEIHSLLRRVAAEKDCVVIIATSEFEELIGLADDIYVMREGHIVASFPGPKRPTTVSSKTPCREPHSLPTPHAGFGAPS